MEQEWEVIVQTYFLDASAIVKLLVKEPGSQKVERISSQSGACLYTSWVLLAEALNCLKTKWRKGLMSDKEYTAKVLLLMGNIEDGELKPVDLELRNGRPQLSTLRVEVLQTRIRYPHLDAADALQFEAIKTGFLKYLAGESAPRLVSADEALLKAAEQEGIECVDVRRD